MKDAGTLLCALVITAATVGVAADAKNNPRAIASEATTQAFAQKASQLGNVVPDLEPAMKWWLERGVGPWFTLGPGLLEHNEYLGKPSNPTVIIALAQVGGVQIELIQPKDQQASAYKDFLAAGNYGLEHCGYLVDPPDYDKAVAQALASGSKMQEKASFNGSHFAYLFMTPVDPMKQIEPGNASPQKVDAIREWIQKSTVHVCSIGEVIEYGETTKKMFGKVIEDSAAWDGKTNPVRDVLSPVEQKALDVYELIQRMELWYKEKK